MLEWNRLTEYLLQAGANVPRVTILIVDLDSDIQAQHAGYVVFEEGGYHGT